MKQKKKIGILIWSLLMLLGTIILAGCSSDDKDDSSHYVYQGYIESIYPEFDEVVIKVTKGPSDKHADVPQTKDVLYVSLEDFSNLNIEVQQKLSFVIKSASMGNMLFHPVLDYMIWNCNIEIIKLY